MNCNSLVIKGIVAFFTVLSILSFSSCGNAGGNNINNKEGANGEEGYTGEALPMAYINIDSLLIKYDYAKDVSENLTKRQEDSRATVNQKQKKLENDMAEFNRKLQNNAFISEDRAQQEYSRLQKQEVDLQETAQRLQNEFLMEQQKENAQIADSVRNAVKILNATGKYEIIFNMRELDNIILVNPKYDITEEVLLMLNTRYKATAKK